MPIPTKGLHQVVLLLLFSLAVCRIEAFSSSSTTLTRKCADAGFRRPSKEVFVLSVTMDRMLESSLEDHSGPFPATFSTTTSPTDREQQQQQARGTTMENNEYEYDRSLLRSFALPPILAFLFWGEVSSLVAQLTNLLGFPGQNVDGNAFANNLLRPTINGVVVPAAGIALGTLFATTVNVLWNRQLMLRTKINTEVCELRHLRRALFGCFGTAQHSKRRHAALSLVLQYTRALIVETRVGSIDRLEEIQLTQGIAKNELDELAEMMHGVDGAAVARQSSVSKVEDLLVSLNAHRSGRVATTLQRFPFIHWSVLSVLYSIIVLSFLLDSNQEVNQYLNSGELRVLFSTIVMVGSGAAMLLTDLEDPFQGSFCISPSSHQLRTFEKLLEEDIAEAAEEARFSGPTLLSLDQTRARPNYNTSNTVYLHLLTGPLASNIRMLGDAVSWALRKLKRGWTIVRNTVRRKPNTKANE